MRLWQIFLLGWRLPSSPCRSCGGLPQTPVMTHCIPHVSDAAPHPSCLLEKSTHLTKPLTLLESKGAGGLLFFILEV